MIKHSVACVFVKENMVLLGKRIPSGAMGGLWEFPGGKVEEGETFEQAVIREFAEEFSVEVSVGPLITNNIFVHNNKNYHLHVYQVFVETDISKWKLTEHTEVKWFDLKDIPSLPFVDSDKKVYPDVVNYFRRVYEE